MIFGPLYRRTLKSAQEEKLTVSAYCSCPAGLPGSCNHVAGMLFRIEAAVIAGVTKPTCTSRLSE